MRLSVGSLVVLQPLHQSPGGARLVLVEVLHVVDVLRVGVCCPNCDDLVVGLPLVYQLKRPVQARDK